MPADIRFCSNWSRCLVSSADFKFIDTRIQDLEANIGHISSDKIDADGMLGVAIWSGI